MKAKHRVLAAGMAAAMTLSLAACGGSASTAEPTASSTVEAAAPEATSEAASGDVTEVTWWTYFGDKNIGYLQNIIDDFNNSQNQYHVTIVYQGNQIENRGAVADFRHRAPVLFLSLRGQLESRFCGFEYTLSSMSFSCAGSRRNTGVFSP